MSSPTSNDDGDGVPSLVRFEQPTKTPANDRVSLTALSPTAGGAFGRGGGERGCFPVKIACLDDYDLILLTMALTIMSDVIL